MSTKKIYLVGLCSILICFSIAGITFAQTATSTDSTTATSTSTGTGTSTSGSGTATTTNTNSTDPFTSGMAQSTGIVTTSTGGTLTGSIDLGASGNNVRTLQIFLATNPTWYPEGLVTGYFGPLTQAALRRFQTAQGLEAVGRVGPLTLARINALLGGSTGGIPGGDMAAPTIFNIQVNSPTTTGTGTGTTTAQNTTTINWSTSEVARSKVYFGTTQPVMLEVSLPRTEPTISGMMITDPSFKTSQSIMIPNLTPNTTYYYVLLSADASGNVTITNPATFIAR